MKKALVGTKKRPRASVFRSNKHIYVQFVDDEKGVSLFSISDSHLTKDMEKKTKTEIAFALGEKAAETAKSKKISEIVFDRGRKVYHGRIKAVAEGMRKGGLNF